MQAAQLADKIHTLGGLAIKDRVYHFKTYKQCFIGESLCEVCALPLGHQLWLHAMYVIYVLLRVPL